MSNGGDLQTRDHMVEVPSGKLFVRIWTPSSETGVPVVLLHDSLGCVQLWRDFPSLLAKRLGRRVIAYDRLGFGQSDERREKLPLTFIQDEGRVYLSRVVDECALDEFILFGHSVGGAMALMAARESKKCRAVISESAQAFIEEKTIQGLKKAKEDFKNPRMMKRLESYHGAKARWVLDAWIETWLSSQFSLWSLKGFLSEVKCPVLVIHGEDDEYGSSAFPKMIYDGVSGFKEMHVLKDFGHVPHRENPTLILNLISNFLTTL